MARRDSSIGVDRLDDRAAPDPNRLKLTCLR